MRTYPRRLRWIAVPLAAIWLLAQVPAPVLADDDPAAELKQAQAKLKEIQAGKQGVQNELNRVFWEAEEAEAQLGVVQQELDRAEARLTQIGAEQKVVQTEMGRLAAELKETEQRYQARKAQFDARLRSIQQQGRVSYVGVLLGSTSFTEAIDRMDALRRVVGQDRELMDDLRKAKRAAEDQRRGLAARQEQLAGLKAQTEVQKQTAQAKVAERKQVAAKVAERQAALQGRVDEYWRQQESVERQIWEAQRRLNRKAGKFAPVRPLQGYHEITSEFGYREEPIYGAGNNHGGTDFDGRYGETIYAIDDGWVLSAAWDDIYGNRIIIDHGNGIASLYGHTSQMLVKAGEAVTQGQPIARVGSTGLSTGPHLHLEIRVNGVKQDPMKYLGK